MIKIRTLFMGLIGLFLIAMAAPKTVDAMPSPANIQLNGHSRRKLIMRLILIEPSSSRNE